MIEGDEPSPRRSTGDSGDSSRAWRHPSEVGLATRGRADRRRSSLVAGGIVVGGLGLLVVGLLLGSERTSGPIEPTGASMERAAASLAAVTVVDPSGASHRATAVALDGSGHLVLHSSSVEDASEVWARTPDGSVVAAELVGADDAASVAVLRLTGPAPDTARIATEMPDADDALLLLQRGRSGLRIAAATLDRPADPVRLVGLDLPQATPGARWSVVVDGSDDAAARAGSGTGPTVTPTSSATATAASGTPSGSAVAVDEDGRVVGIVEVGASGTIADRPHDLVPARNALRAATTIIDGG